ncbi:MAG: phospholipid carrier-dependent glycosyltransferase [Actinomycetota bacterium]|nr:phospholipid carrier-dependent glycosyltransferase [Actinomycetota bacterium]
MPAGHWPFAVVLSAGVALRVTVMLAYRPLLLLQMDTHAYLNQAIETGASGLRPVLYPLLLKPLVATGSLVGVALVQHLAGIAVAILLYAFMRRLGLSAVVAALGTVPALLDGFILNLEHYLLTEAFFNLFVVVALLLVAWPERPAWFGAGASGLIVGLSALLRFIGGVVVAPVLLYLLLRKAGWTRVVALVVGFVLPLAVYGMWFRAETGSAGLTDRNGVFLFGRVVEFADCDEVEVPEDLREFCEVEPSTTGTKGVFTSDLDIQRVMSTPQGNAKLLRYSRLMIIGMPGAYLGAVGADFLRYFEPTSPETREPNVKRWRFVRTLEEADPRPPVTRAEGGPPPDSGIDEEFIIDRGLASFLRSYQNASYTYGPLLALLLVLGFAGGVLGTSSGPARSRAPECWLFSLTALALLLIPTMVAVYHFRYVIPAVPLAGVAGALGASGLLDRLGPRRGASAEPGANE